MSKKFPYPLFDCDNHYYEPAEAILKYLPEQYKHLFKYVQVDGRTKLAIDNYISNYIPNPTFEVVAAPGCHVEYYRGNNPEGKTFREFSVVEKGKSEYQYKTPRRYEVLEEHDLVGTLVFPTLASVIEVHMTHNPGFCHAVIHSLNMWMKEEWGFGEDGKFYSTPVITLMDPEKALEEAKWIIENGSKVVLIRPASVAGIKGFRHMGSQEFDKIWALLEENNIFVTFHNSDNGYSDVYNRQKASVSEGAEFRPFEKTDTLGVVMDVNQLATQHHLAGMICHGVFDRFPTLKCAYIETGSYWLYPLWERFELVYNMHPKDFGRHPHDILKNNIWYHPFFEESVDRLAGLVGAEQVLFGSDWPHPEGLAEPADWVNELTKFSEEDKAKIMGGNIMKLMGLAA